MDVADISFAAYMGAFKVILCAHHILGVVKGRSSIDLDDRDRLRECWQDYNDSVNRLWTWKLDECCRFVKYIKIWCPVQPGVQVLIKGIQLLTND